MRVRVCARVCGGLCVHVCVCVRARVCMCVYLWLWYAWGDCATVVTGHTALTPPIDMDVTHRSLKVDHLLTPHPTSIAKALV